MSRDLVWQLSSSKIITDRKSRKVSRHILDKKKNNHAQEMIKIDQKFVKVKSSVKPLGIQVDAELNLNLHMTNICGFAVNQFKALIRRYQS